MKQPTIISLNEMYNVQKGPSKIAAKSTRRGISQKMDSYRDRSRNKSIEIDNNNDSMLNGPKPVFHQSRKYNNNHRERKDENHITQEHQAVVKYIQESWNTDSNITDDNNNFYYEDAPAPSLRDFKPFDLEAWWGRRLYNSVTSSINN